MGSVGTLGLGILVVIGLFALDFESSLGSLYGLDD